MIFTNISIKNLSLISDHVHSYLSDVSCDQYFYMSKITIWHYELLSFCFIIYSLSLSICSGMYVQVHKYISTQKYSYYKVLVHYTFKTTLRRFIIVNSLFKRLDTHRPSYRCVSMHRHLTIVVCI